MAIFVCSVCNKSFQWQSGLSRHMKVFHQNSTCVCIKYGVLFKREDNLKRHMTSCSVEKVAQTMNEILPSPRCQSISANDIVDNLMEQVREAIKQRDCHQTTLPDKSMAGVKLCSGRLSGLSNLQRWGEADLDMSRNDKIHLSFTLALRDVHATYVWKRKRLRGEIAAGITRVLLHIKLRQKYQGSKSIEVFEYSVGSMEGVHAGLHGLGLLNWVAKKVVKNLVHQNLAQMLDTQAKKIIKEELSRLSILDQITYKLLPNCLLARTPSSSKDILVF